MCVSHNFCIHSSTNGHLGCFHILSIVNKAAGTWGCLYLFQLVFLFSSDKYSEMVEEDSRG